MRAFIQQKQKQGEAHVAKYGTKTSYGPLFGLAYSSPSRLSSSTALIATRHSCDGWVFFLRLNGPYVGQSEPCILTRPTRAARRARYALPRGARTDRTHYYYYYYYYYYQRR